MKAHLQRWLLRRTLGPLLAAAVAWTCLGALGLVGVSALRAPVLPDPATLGRLAILALPTVGSVGLPLVALVGVVATLRRWRARGEWTALRAAGVGGGALLAPLLALALAVGGSCWALAHGPEPRARADSRDLLMARLRPNPGRLISAGPLTFRARGVEGRRMEGVFFAVDGPEGPRVGSAARGRLEGATLTLEDGALHAPGAPPARLDFERLSLPLDAPSPRVDRIERSDTALAELVTRMESGGKNAGFEQAELSRRSAWPVGAGLLVLLAAPLGLRRSLLPLGGVVLGYWAAIRAFDRMARALGGELAAWGPTLLLAAAVAWAWLRWRER